MSRPPRSTNPRRVVSMSRGIVDLFETRDPGIDNPCMTGLIERTAGFTVYEPDDGVPPVDAHELRLRRRQ